MCFAVCLHTSSQTVKITMVFESHQGLCWWTEVLGASWHGISMLSLPSLPHFCKWCLWNALFAICQSSVLHFRASLYLDTSCDQLFAFGISLSGRSTKRRQNSGLGKCGEQEKFPSKYFPEILKHKVKHLRKISLLPLFALFFSSFPHLCNR